MSSTLLIDKLAPISLEYFYEYCHWCTLLTQNSLVKSFISFFMVLYSLFFVRPLAIIYVSAPSWGVLGMWGGDAAEDICTKITTVGSAHWVRNEENMQKCLEIIDAKFQGFLLIVQVFILVFIFYKVLILLYYWFIEYPAIRKRERDNIILRAKLKFEYRTLGADSTNTTPPLTTKHISK